MQTKATKHYNLATANGWSTASVDNCGPGNNHHFHPTWMSYRISSPASWLKERAAWIYDKVIWCSQVYMISLSPNIVTHECDHFFKLHMWKATTSSKANISEWHQRCYTYSAYHTGYRSSMVLSTINSADNWSQHCHVVRDLHRTMDMIEYTGLICTQSMLNAMFQITCALCPCTTVWNAYVPNCYAVISSVQKTYDWIITQ